MLPPGVIAIPDELPPKVGTIITKTSAVSKVKVTFVSKWTPSQKNPKNRYKVVKVQNFTSDEQIDLDGSFTKDEGVTLIMWEKGVTFETSDGRTVRPSLYYDERIQEDGLPITGMVSVIHTERYLLTIDGKDWPMQTLKVFTTQPLTTAIGQRQAAQQCAQQQTPVVPLEPSIKRMLRSELGDAILSDSKATNNSKDPAGG